MGGLHLWARREISRSATNACCDLVFMVAFGVTAVAFGVTAAVCSATSKAARTTSTALPLLFGVAEMTKAASRAARPGWWKTGSSATRTTRHWEEAFAVYHSLYQGKPTAFNALQLACTSALASERLHAEAWFTRAVQLNPGSGARAVRDSRSGQRKSSELGVVLTIGTKLSSGVTSRLR